MFSSSSYNPLIFEIFQRVELIFRQRLFYLTLAVAVFVVLKRSLRLAVHRRRVRARSRRASSVLAAGPAVALYAESEILPGDPSCVTASAGGAVRFVCNSVMVPLRAATQVFAATE